MRFGTFMLGKYIAVFGVSVLMVILFLGGHLYSLTTFM